MGEITLSSWWEKPRTITIVVDNDSWILHYANSLAEQLNSDGDNVELVRSYEAVNLGVAAVFLGCVNIAPNNILARNRYNLVVHESSLPEGRGFAPLMWQIIDGRKHVDICLLEAAEKADSGPVYLRKKMMFYGHELGPELRYRQGISTVEICLDFFSRKVPPEAIPQHGEPDFYKRRSPEDSRLDINKTILEQFNLLRTVDNENYPAFFEMQGYRYRLKIEKIKKIK